MNLKSFFLKYYFSIKGTLIEMEQLAKEAEEKSVYKMNADVVSDTEEWHKRKKPVTSNDKEQSRKSNRRTYCILISF